MARHRLGARLGLGFLLLVPLAGASPLGAADPHPPIGAPGRVLLFRHTLAPGVGDPPGFRLGDCRTQRNLDEAGRRQAEALGDCW